MLPTGAALAAAPDVPASPAAPQDCPLWSVRPAAEKTLALPSGDRAVVRDPYGGLLARNRLFFSFSVKAPQGTVAKVTWAMDGKVVREDPTPPFAWSGLSGSRTRMPAGDHEITVAVQPTGVATPVTTSFKLRATDCQPASASAVVLPRQVTLTAASALEGGAGPALRSVTWSARNLRASIPARVRGRVVGKLAVSDPSGGAPTSYTLRAPRSGGTLLSRGGLKVAWHPGAKRFLTVSGLPAGVKVAELELTGAGAGMVERVRRCEAIGAIAILTTSDGTTSADGGRTSGGCRAR